MLCSCTSINFPIDPGRHPPGMARSRHAIGAASDVHAAPTILRTPSGKLRVISSSRRSGHGYDQRIQAFGSGALGVNNMHGTSVEIWSENGAAGPPIRNFLLESGERRDHCD